jgi:carboxymethylenebutenolidase
MKELGKRYDPVIYQGAEHAFMRKGDLTTNTDDPNRKARDEAWTRWKKLLGQLK